MDSLQAQPTPTVKRMPMPRRGPSRDRRQVVEMQRVLHALTLDASIPARERAQCARAWADLQEKKRILDGKPLPGALRPELTALRSARKQAHKAVLSIAASDLPASHTQGQ